MSTEPRTMTVIVRDHQTEKAWWGRGGPWSPVLRTVTIDAVCPQCGGPRGEVRGHNQYEDGVSFHVNVWNNPCGHIDYYGEVILEADERTARLSAAADGAS